jgi:NHS family xanthosine MFS transporter
MEHPMLKELLKGNPIKADGTLTKAITIQQWEPIWLSFAAYALIVAILFAVLFKHKHDPNEIGEISH